MIPNYLKFDWIPPENRDREQRLLTGEVHEIIGTFEDRNPFLETLPERVIQAELEIKATGGLLPRIKQITGSCVGAGGARAYCLAQCGDVVHRGDSEEIKVPFWLPTYGVGRQLAGMNGVGEGSFGSAQAKAVATFGMLPVDYEGAPKPTIKNGWLYYTEREEMTYSHPSAFPIPYEQLKQNAVEYLIQSVTRITTLEGLLQALAQGYGVTTASMFGTRPRVEHGRLVGRWNDSWAHQQSHGGYDTTVKELGLIVLFDNQWGDMHGHCPLLYDKYGITGSYWTPEKDIVSVIKKGEVFAHSDTKGFPRRQIDWGTLGI